MKIIKMPVNPFAMNCYIYYDENTKEGVIIDPAVYSDEEKNDLKKFIEENKISIKYILNTHGHLDHILGNKFAKDYFNVPVLIHKDDLFLLENSKAQAELFDIDMEELPPADTFIDENSVIELPSFRFKIIHTPGHSPGSVCFIDESNKIVFCGDLIFKNSVGRSDLQGGDHNVLISSIKNNLFKNTEDDYDLYPGHMETTNVGDEKKLNSFLI
ncbi:MAG: MBL fold metallo-hydrolase [bacterium]|nr:MBL fold metallo-hydrolase [bacterium]